MNFVFQNPIKYKRNVQLKNLLIKVNQFNDVKFSRFFIHISRIITVSYGFIRLKPTRPN